LSADEAKEVASYKANRYIESRLKVTIVDMNHLDRAEAAAKCTDLFYVAIKCFNCTQYLEIHLAPP
jgi:hypothetical protein